MKIRSESLLTDLYQLTMLQGYFDQRMDKLAVFEFFVRRLPSQRNFLVVAGLDQVLDFLESFRFSEEELAWLRSLKNFRPDFIDYLGGLRFTGDVEAMPEGSIVMLGEARVAASAATALRVGPVRTGSGSISS